MLRSRDRERPIFSCRAMLRVMANALADGSIRRRSTLHPCPCEIGFMTDFGLLDDVVAISHLRRNQSGSIWVRSGSNNTSSGYFWAPKLAVSAV